MKIPPSKLNGLKPCCAIVFSLMNVTAAMTQEKLYGVRIQTGLNVVLDRVDTNSGATTTAVFPSFGPVGMRSLVSANDRLLTVSQLIGPDRFTEIHPANAEWQYGLHTGFDQQCCISLDYDPTSSTHFYADGQSLYRVDPATGASILVGPFTGLSSSFSGVTSLAIYPDGSAIAHGLGPMSLNAPVELYTLDLQTAALSQIAGVVVPNALGQFTDLAVDSNGELWGAFGPSSSTYQQSGGLYHIDLATWTVTHVRHVYPSYTGIAFVPDTQQTTYCVAKTNSLGCVPSISADGFPSPTASSGYVLRAVNVRNQTAGSLTFGIGGRAALPFGGGTNCIAPPRQRTPVSSSGGSSGSAPDCSGAWQLDFNTWMSQYYTLPAGTTVQAQWFGRDLGFPAPTNWTLSDAVEFTVRP